VFTPRKFRKLGLSERFPKTTIAVVGIGGFVVAYSKIFYDMYVSLTMPSMPEMETFEKRHTEVELKDHNPLLHPILYVKGLLQGRPEKVEELQQQQPLSDPVSSETINKT